MFSSNAPGSDLATRYTATDGCFALRLAPALSGNGHRAPPQLARAFPGAAQGWQSSARLEPGMYTR